MQVAGSLRRVHHALGDFTAAVRVQREVVIAHAPRDQLTRCYSDLAASLLSLGDRQGAIAALNQSRDAASEVTDQGGTLRFVEIQEIRAGIRQPREAVLGSIKARLLYGTDTLECLELLVRAPGNELATRLCAAANSWLGNPSGDALAHFMVYLRYVAQRMMSHDDLPASSDWIVGMLDALDRCETSNMGEPAMQALAALRRGEGEPWYRLCPY
jgi:hypothetical protein